MSTEDWIDYSINYRKYSKECCEKYGKSKGVKELQKPEQPKYPNKDSVEYTYYCNFYNNSGRTR